MKGGRPKPGRYSVDAVAKALRILSEFSTAQPRLSLASLPAQTSIPRATAFRLLSTLEEAGFVVREDGERLLIIRGTKGELVSATSKSVLYQMEMLGAETFDLAWDRGHLLGSTKDTAHVWDTATGTLVKSYPLPR